MRKLLSILITMGLLLAMGACGAPNEKASSVAQGKVSMLGPQSAAENEEDVALASASRIPANLNLITGEKTLTQEAEGKRSVSVMINNATASLSQYGISEADLIFELPVEGDVTRLMAVYGDYTQVPEIASIRSCRYYYPILAAGFDTVYIHWGLDPTVARRTLDELKIDNIDGNSGTYGLFDRDQSRLDEGYALEHTSRLDGTAIPTAFAENNVRTDLQGDKRAPFFTFNQQYAVSGTQDVQSLRVDFGANSGWGYYSDFTYHEESKSYFKTHNEKQHVDDKTEQQLHFTNVFVLETPVGDLPNDDSGRREIDVTGEGKAGYYFTGGKMQEITWSKKDAKDSLHFFDATGKELGVNTGKSYIAFCAKGSLKTEF